MKNKELAQRIKALRSRKGLSQEELSETAGLSLRTIQRIENGETEPRGDSLKKIAFAFNVAPDEISDWTVQEDKGFLTSLNLSALSFLVFPLLGILVPLVIWISKKDKIRNLNEMAKEILNFQITWTMLLFLGYIGIILSIYYQFNKTGDVDMSIMRLQMMLNLGLFGIMYTYNLLIIIVNSIRVNNNKNVHYYPHIRFLRN